MSVKKPLAQYGGVIKELQSGDAIAITAGGTGFNSFAIGDIIFASATNALSKLAAVTNGYVLTLVSGMPAWAAASSGTSLPSQTGNSGKYLTTNGTAESWATVSTSVDTTLYYTWTGTHTFSPSNGVAMYIGDACAIRGNSYGGTMYIDASRDLSGSIVIRATSLSLPGFSNSYVATEFLTVGGSVNPVSTLTGSGTVSFRITNTASSATWFFECSRNGVAGSLEITNDLNSNCFTISPSRTIGIGISNAAASAHVDITSTTRGFLSPRMTTTQKNAIASPAEGLEVFDLTLHKKCVYTGSAWETVTSS